MRHIIIVLLFTLWGVSTSAQVSETEAAQFPGGIDSLNRFLQNNIKFPAAARIKNIRDTVFVGFNINIDGSIYDITSKEKGGEGCAEETIRAIKLMPKWVNNQGSPFRVILPIIFDSSHKKVLLSN